MVEENMKQGHKWMILLTVIIGTFLGRIDQTIVNLALPKIIESFSITVSSAGWIATAYILANAIFVPIWGKLGDTIGRKKVYITGFAIFILGSVLAGISWNLSSMIVFRIIQAIASSADYPTAMAILAVTFAPGRERAQALGIWSTSFAAAAVFGPLIGGPLIDHFNWRSVFLVNLPVGIVGMTMAIHYVKESVSEIKTVVFDWWGAITLGVSLSAMVLVLDQGITWGWFAWQSLVCYAACVIFLLVFIYIEGTIAEPIVDLKFFKNGIFVSTLVNNFVVFMALAGGIFLVPIFAQTFLGLSATQSGYLFIPMAFCLVAASPIGGAFVGRVQPRFVIIVSTLVAALGVFLFSYLDPRSGVMALIIPLGIMAFGLGLGMPQRTNIIASIVPTEEIGVASSILALVRNISGAFGIAVFSTILTNATNSKALQIAQNTHISALGMKTVGVLQEVGGLIILKADVAAYDVVFLTASIVLLIGAFLAIFINLQREKTGVKVHVEA